MNKISVILADEDQRVLNTLKESFTDDKYEVIATTTSGNELINLVKQHNPDIAIFDIVLRFLVFLVLFGFHLIFQK